MSIYSSFLFLYRELTPAKKKTLFFLFPVMLLLAVLETGSVGLIALFVSSISSPLEIFESPYVSRVQPFLPDIFFSSPRHLIIAFGCVVAIVITLKNLLQLVFIYWKIKYKMAIDGFFGELLMQGFLSLPYEWHLYKNSTDLILAVTWRVHFSQMIQAGFQFLSDLLIIVFLITSLLIVNPVISLIVIFMIGGTAIFIYKNIRFSLDKNAHLIKNFIFSINRHVANSMQGIREVKILGRENLFLHDFNREVFGLSNAYVKTDLYQNTPSLILETLGFIMLIVSIATMYSLSNASSLEITGTITLLVVCAWKILPGINRILYAISNFHKSLPQVEKVSSYIKEINNAGSHYSVKELEEKEQLTFRGQIAFHNVSFSYQKNSTLILEHINFTIKKGQSIGIIGSSGAGKSTLVDLMIGLLPPTEGNIAIDGNIMHMDLAHRWRKIMGYVPQAPFIFDGSLAENVAFRPNGIGIDRDRVENCCMMAALQDVISELPDGIDSQIGERGVQLSGGQRQRITIARALYDNPEVLIFDEATSSLDKKNEKEIQETINSLKGKWTLVIIAHRLSTVNECDWLIWLEKGKIKMTGTPQDILPVYSKYMK